ncbi:TolB family protein [Amycolatopsis sp. NPDC059657]|uniref:TolB family protein n=1 Tax=Amycolatopsis sp. NPDC059657 TaxID=3346899 RepID=UPI00366D3C3C
MLARRTLIVAAALPVALLLTGAIVPVTEVVSGHGNAPSDNAYVSRDGRFVAFQSFASNLVPGDTNNASDIFVRDRQLGTLTRANVTAYGGQADAGGYEPSISADGRFVAFTSNARTLVPGRENEGLDVYVKDLRTGKLTVASRTPEGVWADNVSYLAEIAADGRSVVYFSVGSNLVPGDVNGAPDVFRTDLVTGKISLVSVTADGAPAFGMSDRPTVSADGRYVAFRSNAGNLAPGDGRGRFDAFVKDLKTGNVTRVSTAADAERPRISGDGSAVTFSSAAALIPGDTNGFADIYVKDLPSGKLVRASVTADGRQGDELAYRSALSADGRFAVFESKASNLTPGDMNKDFDVFVKDLRTGALTRLGAGAGPVISGDGRSVVFDGQGQVFHSRLPKPDADPFANAIASASNVLLLNGKHALGAPDGRTATVIGLLGGRFTLDLGDEEEGVGDLEIRGRCLGSVHVDLLDAQGKKVGSSRFSGHLVRHAGAPYRYIRFSIGLLQTLSVDGVRAS